MSSEEYLTIDELAARLKVSPKTIRNKMASGSF
ncbi:MAG: HTH domain-containing protein [Deltaproteobacteria bacterium]|nr:HTH domain-containing protein [Deltaproteobacteria bacterium]